MTDPDAITVALDAAREDPRATERLVELVYDQLRAIAEARMRHERVGHTLQATSLVNEACIRLLGPGTPRFEDRGHFFGAAAEAMRRILVDHARQRGAAKRGGPDRRRVPLDIVDLAAESDPADVLALDEALATLMAEDPQAGAVVRLRFFAGLTIPETAAALGISERTVARDWAFARARLTELIEGPADDGADESAGTAGEPP